MKKLIAIVCFIFISAGLYAQPHLKVITTPSPYVPFPAIVSLTNPATTYGFNVVLINNGSVTFNGNIDILLQAGSAPSITLISNYTINNMNGWSSDTIPFQISNFAVDGTHFLNADDIVVIWPRVNSADTFAAATIGIDSLSFPIHVNNFTGVNELSKPASLAARYLVDQGILQIQNNSGTPKVSIALYNSTGSLVFETTTTDQDIPLPCKFPDGVYILEMNSLSVRVVQKISIF